MKKKLNAILEKLEKIEENQLGQLQGGFSGVNGDGGDQAGIFNKNCKTGCTNNCKGGNCVAGCGAPPSN